MILNALADHLAAQVPRLHQGKTLFVERIPVSAVDGVLIRTGLDGITIDPETLLRKGEISVILRATSITQGRVQINDVVSAMTLPGEVILGDYLIKQFYQRGEPVIYPISEGKNVEFAVAYSIIYAIIK